MADFIAIGDIHGMSRQLDELLSRLPGEGEPVFLGDYVDRGPDSCKVVARLIELQDERPCHFLQGNHEEMLLAALAGDRAMERFWLRNGGLQTLESYGGHIPDDHVAFLRATLPYYITERYIFVHAGLRPGLPVEDNIGEDYLWIREPFLNSTYDWGRLVIHGHTPTPNFSVDAHANRVNLDTGAVYGGMLTALLLPEFASITAT